MKLYKVTLSTGAEYTLTGEPLAGYGTDYYTFTLDIAEGYSKTDNFMVDVNGAPMRSKDGVYTVSNVTSDVFVTVFGVADITPPDAQIEIGTNKFNSFMNRLTFGLFFKQTQTVTVTASDKGSGLAKTEYLLSETAFADKDAITGEWTELSLADGAASFDIEPNSNAFVYVRVTDESGNVGVINSDGVVIYTDAGKVTESVTFVMNTDENVAFMTERNENSISAIYNGTQKLKIADFTLYTGGMIRLKNSYLRTLAAGEYTIRVAFDPLGEKYVEREGNDAPADIAIKLTVEKKTPFIYHVSSDKKRYDGTTDAQITFDGSIEGLVEGDDVTIVAGSAAFADKNAGDAKTVTFTGFALAGSSAANYTLTAQPENTVADIFAKELTIDGLKVKDKQYDGKNTAQIDGAPSLVGVVEGDTLKLVNGVPTFDSVEIGEDISVSFTEFSLAGDAVTVGNYVLRQPVGEVFSLTGDTDAVYVIRAVDKAGKVTQCTVMMKPISSKTDAISEVTIDNVKSSDADEIANVEHRIMDIAEGFDDGESTDAEWKKLTDAAGKCRELNERIAQVAQEITRLTDGVNGYEKDKVTSDDKADIERLIADIDALLGADNLTQKERDA